MKKEKSTANHYVNNKEFLSAILERKIQISEALEQGLEKPRISEYLGSCLMKIAEGLSHKANFANYTFRDEMVLDGIENCLRYFDNFDPAKSSNPFAFYTQINYFAFLRRIAKEKKDQETKYKYIESLDLNEIITQGGDESEYANNFLQYLKKQIDQANKELNAEVVAKPKRRPMYLNKKKAEELIEGAILPLDDLLS